MNTTIDMILISGVYQMAHPHKSDISKGGEDSYFISSNNHTIGVADGVGGWRKHENSQSHKWSQDIMRLCSDYSHVYNNSYDIISNAYSDIDKSI